MRKSNHLILFTLGPVQSFIAQARKTQDLYAGSKLLSDLIKLAIHKVGESNLIFPVMGDAMPNRFLAYVPAGVTNLQEYGEEIEKGVRNEWLSIANNCLSKITSTKPDGFDEQINSHLEIFWVVGEKGDSYSDAVQHIERQLAAVKNTRPFCQYNYSSITGEKGRKCSLDGQKNVLFFGNETNPVYTEKKWNPDAQILNQQPNVLISKNEGLSAVSLTKRFWLGDSFPSTAEIALRHDEEMLDGHHRDCLKEYKERVFNTNAFLAHCLGSNSNFHFGKGDKINQFFDYQLLFNDNVNEKNFPFEPQLNLATAYVKKLKPYLKQKYYAILTFDGDEMGKWLAGEWLADGSDLEAFHSEFAKLLARFAKEARKEVDKVGKSVYAGGDDFLGFVNLFHLLPVLKRLRELFREMVSDPLAKFRKEREISFTAGICIAHYKEPLSLVLDAARNAQKDAKSLDGKNAFGITVIKGSGESHTAITPFGTKEENVDRIHNLITQLIKGNFSNTFMKSIQMEFGRVEISNQKITYDNMFSSELIRLLRRSATSRWDKDEKKKQSVKLCEDLMKLKYGDPYGFFQLLNIADFLQRVLDVSIVESK